MRPGWRCFSHIPLNPTVFRRESEAPPRAAHAREVRPVCLSYALRPRAIIAIIRRPRAFFLPIRMPPAICFCPARLTSANAARFNRFGRKHPIPTAKVDITAGQRSARREARNAPWQRKRLRARRTARKPRQTHRRSGGATFAASRPTTSANTYSIAAWMCSQQRGSRWPRPATTSAGSQFRAGDGGEDHG